MSHVSIATRQVLRIMVIVAIPVLASHPFAGAQDRAKLCPGPTFVGGSIEGPDGIPVPGHPDEYKLVGPTVTCPAAECKSSLGKDEACTKTRTSIRWSVEGKVGGPHIAIVGGREGASVRVKGTTEGTGTLQAKVTACCGIYVTKGSGRSQRTEIECEHCITREPLITKDIRVVDVRD